VSRSDLNELFKRNTRAPAANAKDADQLVSVVVSTGTGSKAQPG
jgi:hypothetical protein